jgi:hypothetical protein
MEKALKMKHAARNARTGMKPDVKGRRRHGGFFVSDLKFEI